MKPLSMIVLVLSLLSAGCGSGAKKALMEKQAEAAEIDRLATAAASALTQRALQEDESARREKLQKVADERQRLQQSLLTNPAQFFEVGELEMVSTSFRHLKRLALTNQSQFLVTDVHGTLDFHGSAERSGTTSDLVASTPVELVGSIAPGASMVFSESEGTLKNPSIQLPAAPSQVTFAVTGMSAVGTANPDQEPPPDAGL